MTLPSPTRHSQLDRRSLALFFVLTICISLIAYIPLVQSGSLDALGGRALDLLMWAPGTAAVITTLMMFRSVAPLGLLGNKKTWVWLAVCLLLPIAYTLLFYLPLAGLGLVSLGTTNLNATFFVYGLLVASLPLALGEELGWRGFAAPVIGRVMGFKVGQAVLGFIWFLYHLPPLLLTDYGDSPHPLFGNFAFLVSVVALSYFLAMVRQRTDSVWPCALFHASHNLFFSHLFDPMVFKQDVATWFVGEQGILLAIAMVALGIYGLRTSQKPATELVVQG
ncbi:MAG: CPBP family intramembrane metalloprotease [Oscillatoriophycideae cyanobacterium NC_groundwater_1537_Pr4_S-0.65um_50_18]|nr:CPBP family intramembrane metalloprotease [Oscillatoriophycideae cyanobacterium NC_groundwater_1537_Pr4_S-0.65um_50_18]